MVPFGSHWQLVLVALALASVQEKFSTAEASHPRLGSFHSAHVDLYNVRILVDVLLGFKLKLG
eukprot:1096388-Amphidinium_carterae.1